MEREDSGRKETLLIFTLHRKNAHLTERAGDSMNLTYRLLTYLNCLKNPNNGIMLCGIEEDSDFYSVLASDGIMQKSTDNLMFMVKKEKIIVMKKFIILLPFPILHTLIKQEINGHKYDDIYRSSCIEKEIYVDHQTALDVGYPSAITTMLFRYMYTGFHHGIKNRLFSLLDAYKRVAFTNYRNNQNQTIAIECDLLKITKEHHPNKEILFQEFPLTKKRIRHV